MHNAMSAISQALASIDRLPMWDAGFAAGIAWFQFGKAVTRPDAHGGTRVVGQYALHVSCFWRWVAPSGFVRADETSPPQLLKTLGADRPTLNGADSGKDGSISLRFDNGDVLFIAGASEDPDEDVEHWRLFQPGSLAPHFVASSSGAEWHEV
jgi:hypothetical protein